MGFFDDAVPGGNITKPLMIAVGALLIGKLFSHGSSSSSETASAPSGSAASGGLGGLLTSLTGAGLGDAVESWIQSGENKPVSPGALKSALGSQTISDLAAKSGINEDQLLQELAAALPGIIDKLTANGKVPSQADVEHALKS